MYLHLKKKNPKTFLVPCYDMDLIWHTHQVHPQDYQCDMNHILGFVLKHDDSVNDRSEGSKLNNADEMTRKLWFEEFNVPFARPGSMFRGKPPQGKLFPISNYFQRSLLALREMDVTVSSVKISDLPNLEEESLVLSVQLQTDEKGQKMNKKKKQELYHNLHNLSDENELEVTHPDGLLQFVATHTSQPKLNIKAVKPGKKSGVAAFFGCNPRHESVAQSEAPIDVFSLARENGGGAHGSGVGLMDKSVVTVNHRLSEKDGVNKLHSEVTISMGNERLGQLSEVVFSILEGSFYNCVMPGKCKCVGEFHQNVMFSFPFTTFYFEMIILFYFCPLSLLQAIKM